MQFFRYFIGAVLGSALVAWPAFAAGTETPDAGNTCWLLVCSALVMLMKGLFMANLTGVIAVAVFSYVVTYLIVKIVGVFVPIRVGTDAEGHGLDSTQHGEFARVNAMHAYSMR